MLPVVVVSLSWFEEKIVVEEVSIEQVNLLSFEVKTLLWVTTVLVRVVEQLIAFQTWLIDL
jgi:hypothetical protein